MATTRASPLKHRSSPSSFPTVTIVWLVSRYDDDVAALLKDPRLVKDRHNAVGSRPFSRLPGMLGFPQALERTTCSTSTLRTIRGCAASFALPANPLPPERHSWRSPWFNYREG